MELWGYLELWWETEIGSPTSTSTVLGRESKGHIPLPSITDNYLYDK